MEVIGDWIQLTRDDGRLLALRATEIAVIEEPPAGKGVGAYVETYTRDGFAVKEPAAEILAALKAAPEALERMRAAKRGY